MSMCRILNPQNIARSTRVEVVTIATVMRLIVPVATATGYILAEDGEETIRQAEQSSIGR
jgi:hypothetical protein